jgi:hypothetical protein
VHGRRLSGDHTLVALANCLCIAKHFHTSDSVPGSLETEDLIFES